MESFIQCVYTHGPHVELEVTGGVCLRNVRPGLTPVNAAGRCVKLLPVHLWG
jgi:hypothetical protein